LAADQKPGRLSPELGVTMKNMSDHRGEHQPDFSNAANEQLDGPASPFVEV
jgi:hypothetical protein